MKDTFNLRRFLTENKLTSNSKILSERDEDEFESGSDTVSIEVDIPVLPLTPEDREYAEGLDSFKIPVRIVGTYHMEDEGIGPYEFWGTGGYDTNYQPTFDSVEADPETFNPAYEEQIKSWMEKNDSTIEQQLADKITR